MKELKIEENVKLKVSPGVEVQIISPSRSSITIKGAEHVDLSVQDSKNMTISHANVADVTMTMTNVQNTALAAYNSDVRYARN